MPRLRPKQKETPQGFEFVEAVCTEPFSAGWSDPIQKGHVYPRDHHMVQQFPQFWRLLGPRPDEEVRKHDAR
jgi:hypothetical protein